MTKRLKRESLTTEQQNVRSMDIDTRSVSEILKIINDEDTRIPQAVNIVLPQVAKTVELTVTSIKSGGSVFYVGAGTSGRLGVLDAAECPPTFSAPPDMFRGIIAGGDKALKQSIEGAEDHPEDAVRDLKSAGLKTGDVVIGIASSSTTPYVIRALEYGRSIRTKTVFLICNPEPLIPVNVDVLISVDVGQEIITGSTRMKSATATKMILNMISTATMIRLGKVYGNLMVDLMAINEKLMDRGTRIISKMTSLSYDEANDLLFQANREVKTGIVMHHQRCDYDTAKSLLKENNGFLRPLIETYEKN